ncbi:DUF11 domain-containing protein [Microbacterium jejuense]|uniref:DUF11 domain-containing protein n=1 Tax=Microbacterium jejuense TaxID=1263637 RepID=A0ABS7HQ86_9MICO|nr:isopeptide-forming domain-containing fimbrial protein [Microbacterium jejuense]MBW9094843.1 DUF11 domain-containing protein [Microbacterium jejuense]
MAAVLMVVSGMAATANAAIVAEHEITANWAAPVPTSVLYGNPVIAEWHINTNDAEQPETNQDVTNVTATLTASNGKFASIPTVCKTTGVTPVSSLSADGVTLVCNVGTVKSGTATVLQTPIRATSVDGQPLSASGSVSSDQAAAPSAVASQTPLPVTYNYGMDLVISTPSSNPAEGGQRTRYFEGAAERQYMIVDWAVAANVGSRPGPANYSFILNVATSTTGANPNLITPEECRPVNGEVAAGIPFSATNRADRAAFPGGCTITKLNATQYRVTLTGIDYSLTKIPVKDSKGQNLPAGKNYIASGALILSHPSPVTVTQTFNFTANAPAWTYPGTTQTTADPTANNTDAITLYTQGDFSNHWAGTPASSRSAWDDQLFVSAGTGSTWTPGAGGTALPLYMQANSLAWNDYRGPGSANLAGVCTMNQSATTFPSPESNNFVLRYMDGAGWDAARGGYQQMSTLRYWYTTANIDTRTFTCDSTAVNWVNATPAGGVVGGDPRTPGTSVVALPANVTALKVTWNPAVDKPLQVFVRGFGYIKANATPWVAGAPNNILEEGWTVGSFNRPNTVTAAANTWYNVGHTSGSVATATPWSPYTGAAGGTNGYRDVFRIVGNTGTISKSASPQTAGPGQPVTYTVRAATNSTTTPPTNSNLTVVDLLPAGMQYVAGSAKIDGTAVTPTSATVSGRQQLTFAITNSPANTQRVITYQAMLPANATVAPGTTLTNTAEVRVPGDNRELALRQASASVVVPNNGTTTFGKSSNATFVPYAGGSSFWRMTLNSLDPSSNAYTDTIDILPYKGDENGTNIDGGYEVTRVSVPATTWRVFYTTADPSTLSDDARTKSNGTNPGSIAGNTVGWTAVTLSGTNAPIPADATAIRVIGPALAPGAQQSFDVHFTTASPTSTECSAPAAGDNKPGQVIVNAATSIAAHTGLPMKSSATTTIADCNQIEIKKYVLEKGGDPDDASAWHDAQDASDFPQYARDDSVPYRITVTNRGTGTLTDVAVTDPMFPQCAFTVASLAAGASQSRDCTAGPAALGTTINEAFVNVTPPVGEPLTGSDPAGIVVPLPPTITKTSDPASGTPVLAGDRVTYSVAVTEPEDSPAPFLSPSFVDDLTAVLDDADIDEESITVTTSAEDGDPGSAVLDGNALRWSNDRIFPGETVTISYTVVVKDYDEVGDFRLRNVVTPGTDIECAACTTEHPVPGIHFTKSATPSTINPGGTVTYTVEVRNTGQVAYGENGFAAASVTDPLTDVLKDATWAGTSSPGVTFDPATGVSWSGPLAVGATTSFSFDVQVKAAGVDEDARDDRLENTIVSDTPGSNCAEGSADPDCEATVLVQSYTVEKSTAEAPVVRGDVVTYTITVRNTGEVGYTAEAPASFDDDLADVLDDADFVAGSATGGAVFADGHLTWSGALAIGQVRSFTYSVAVKQNPNPESMVLNNTVTPTGTGGSCAGEGLCDTSTPIAQFHVAKSSDPAYVNPGGTVHYRVVVTNTGGVAFTDGFPASFRDSFAGIVDDGELAATIDDDGQIVDGSVTWTAGDLRYQGSVLDWSGPLAVDGTVTIEYDVLVDNPDRGDHLLANRITTPTGLANCDTGSTDPVCETETPVQSYELVKTADTDVAEVGDAVTYTITVRNTGNVPYPAGAGEPQAAISDPIGDVLEHATNLDDLQVVSGGGTATYDAAAQTIRWAGDLPVGDGTVVISYTVQITSATEPDERLLNRASTDSPGGNCDPATDFDVADPRCWVEIPTRSYQVVKSVNDTVVEPGQQDLTYTITVTNTGSEAYTGTAIGDENAAEIRDDLTDTLGDSGSPVLVSQPSGWQVTFEDGVLVAAGPLDVDQTVTFVYTVDVDDPDAGDHRMDNRVETPPGRGGNCTPMSTDGDCDATVLVREFTVEKTVQPEVVEVGDTVVYTVTVRNTGAVAYTDADPAGFSDDLTDVLRDADWGTVLQGGAVFDGDSTLTWSGALPIGGEAVIRYTVVAHGETDDDILVNDVDPVGPGGSCAAEGSCTTEVPIRSFEYEKEVDATSLTEGDDVTYTITVRNTGAVAYTEDAPADVVDDLSGVLDDAGDLRDITITPDQGEATVAGSALRWEGPLAVDGTLTISYTLTVDDPDAGDHYLVNTVTSTTGACTEEGACTTDTPVRSYLVEKSSTPGVVTPGGDVVYTVTVTNTGAVAYTDDDPASFTDDLTDVLDVAGEPFDLTVEGASDNPPTWHADDSELRWQGELPVGGLVTVKYTVTVDATVDEDADFLLENVVAPTGPGGECGLCETITPIRAYDTVKTSSHAQAEPGDVVTYTVRVENIGQVAYAAPTQATFTDDLSGVLDDASGPTGLTGGATFADGILSWAGDLPIGGVATITYSVTVLDPQQTPTPPADGILRNAVVTPPDGGCAEATAPDCVTETPVRALHVEKSVDQEVALAGDVIEYTVEVTNTGAVDFTSDAPAAFDDGLARLIDDVTTVTAESLQLTATAGEATYNTTTTTIHWEGPLAAGASATITYRVTIANPDRGDHTLVNRIVTPPGIPSNCEAESEDPLCTTTTLVKSYHLQKSADRTEFFPGDVVEYTITLENTGQVAYTDQEPVVWDDPLTDVLDDATYNLDAVATSSMGGALNPVTWDPDAGALAWSGKLDVGEVITFTYSVSVRNPAPEGADKVLFNRVTSTTPGGNCSPTSEDPVCEVDLGGPSVHVTKTSSKQTAFAGEVVEYAITVTNDGGIDWTAERPAQIDDSLVEVLDDAVYNDDATEGAELVGSRLKWQGPLAVGESVTIEYSVTINAPRTGDGILDNVVTTPAEVPSNCSAIAVENPGDPSAGADPAASTDPDCATRTLVQSYATVKTSDAGAEVKPGDTVTYTITVTNTGQVAYTDELPATFVDDFAGVLDDARYLEDATGGATFDGARLTWAGPLEIGAVTTVTYSFVVSEHGGDNIMRNVVFSDGEIGGNCVDPSVDGCLVETPVKRPLAITGGGGVEWPLLALLVGLLSAGGLFLWLGRRRRTRRVA